MSVDCFRLLRVLCSASFVFGDNSAEFRMMLNDLAYGMPDVFEFVFSGIMCGIRRGKAKKQSAGALHKACSVLCGICHSLQCCRNAYDQ